MTAVVSRNDFGNSKRSETEEVDRLTATKHTVSKLITAIGNFSIQYNFQSISIALLVMATGNCTLDDDGGCGDGEQAAWVTTSASAMVFIGAITGQLTMGYAGDLFGRNAAMKFTLSLVVFGAIMSAAASQGSPTAKYIVIIIARFILGIGAGGVYPLSATKAAEDSGSHGGVDIHAAAAAFFWQQPGAMAPWCAALVLTAVPNMSNDTLWRLLLGLGAVPAAMVVSLSLYEMKVKRLLKELMVHSAMESQPAAGNKDDSVVREMLSQWSTWKDLLATGGGWFIYDIAYYGVNLFGGEILSKISPSDDDNISSHHSIAHISGLQLIGLSMGVPACLLSMLCLRYMSTKTLQILGFGLITFFFTLMAALFVPLRDSNSDALFAIYVGLLFSLSFGPNLTTYVLPAQTYPKKVRATMNGMSAAAGKLGAFTGVYLFGSVADASTYPTVMAICAVLSALGGWVSYQYITHPDAMKIADSSAASHPADMQSMLHSDVSQQGHDERHDRRTPLLGDLSPNNRY